MAATALVRLATFVAVRIVLAQEEGWDNEGGVSSHLHKALSAYIADHPIESPTEWLSQLIRDQDPELRKVALRVLEVTRPAPALLTIETLPALHCPSLHHAGAEGVPRERGGVLVGQDEGPVDRAAA